MKTAAGTLVVVIILLALVVLFSSAYTVKETEQVIVTQFGKPIGRPVTQAGLHFKTPFLQVVNVLEKRIMEWDGYPNEIQTKDKLFINVDTYARWRIKDPLLFFQRLRNETSALSRIDDILDGETRNTIARYELLEIIRTTNRKPAQDLGAIQADVTLRTLRPVSVGREKIVREVFEKGAPILAGLGIELLDVQFKRINYSSSVQAKIYERMISERKQIAEKFRAEGEAGAAEIRGQKERELKRIESEAYKNIQLIRGNADARATDIYARAYTQTPESYAFYQFVKTMETYRVALDKSATLILSTKGDLFKFLKGTGMEGTP